jgi:hypothetical protein
MCNKSELFKDALIVVAWVALAAWFAIDSDLSYRVALVVAALVMGVGIIWRLIRRHRHQNRIE